MYECRHDPILNQFWIHVRILEFSFDELVGLRIGRATNEYRENLEFSQDELVGLRISTVRTLEFSLVKLVGLRMSTAII